MEMEWKDFQISEFKKQFLTTVVLLWKMPETHGKLQSSSGR